VKGQKENKILTRQENRSAFIALRTYMLSSRPNVFYFFPTAHFLKTIIASRTLVHLQNRTSRPATQVFQKSQFPYPRKAVEN